MPRSTVRYAVLSVALLILGLLAAPTAFAAPAPGWQVFSSSNTTVAPGEELMYHVSVTNQVEGEAEATLKVELPPEFTAVSVVSESFPPIVCGDVAGLNSFECGTEGLLPRGPFNVAELRVFAQVPADAEGVQTAHFEAYGDGQSPDTTVDNVTISSAEAAFGLDSFDVNLRESTGGPSTQAAARPGVISTWLRLTTHTDTEATFSRENIVGPDNPVEPVKDLVVDLPPGFAGLPSGFGQCDFAQLTNGEEFFNPLPLCPKDSQLGVATVMLNVGGYKTLYGPYPIFNMVAPPGVPSRAAFRFFGNVVVTLDASIRSGSDYGITLASRNTSETLPVIGSKIDFWGVPADPAHDSEHACPGSPPPGIGGTPCLPEYKPISYLRNPTSCTAAGEGLLFTARVSSWFHPQTYVSSTTRTHQDPGFPVAPEDWGAPVGIEGCEQVPFEPALTVAPTSRTADSPSGLEVDISLPQTRELGALDQADLRKAVLTLPQGMTLNPSSSSGLGSCSPGEIGLLGSDFAQPYPIHFTPDPANCPDNSKIGTVEIQAAALDHPLKGSVYLAKQADNPFHSLVTMYVAVVDPASGVVLKLPGLVESDPNTGRLTTTFDSNPQLPFEQFKFNLFGGPRAALRTPPTCGTYTAQGALTPWSGTAAVGRSSSFAISECPNSGFNPKLDAGTQNPLAGTYSPLHVRLSREDGTAELGGLRMKLPQGLLANLGSVGYCSDAALAAISPALGTGAAQVSAPSCPASSQIGTVTVGAGSGVNPFYSNTGRAYWAGPYKGAPFSIATVVPAVAGPFDLGTVVVRNALQVNPDTAEITAVSDPLPSILFGIPLDLRDIRIDLNRPNYTLNPTSCEPRSVDATITSTSGQSAQRTNRFQAAGCDRLGFKPKLAFALKGAVHRGAHPALSATYTTRPGDANLARAQVKLPPAAFLDQSHIGTVCTRVQFAAQACPAASIYGKASATSPILGYPLYGNVYLRSSSHKLPDLIVDLRGPSSQPIEVALAGTTDSVKGALRNTFELVPDAPVSKFHLTLFGKKRGLIEMSNGFCAHPDATVKLGAQNGRAVESNPAVRAKCGKAGATKKRHRGSRAK